MIEPLAEALSGSTARRGSWCAWKRRRYFGGLDNRRVALAKTFDVRLEDPTVRRPTLEFLQTGVGWWHTSGRLRGKRRPTMKFSVTGKRIT